MMKVFRFMLAAGLAVSAAAALAAYDVRMFGVVFDDSAETFETSDKITADESVMYRLRPKEGQNLRVRLTPDNNHTDFIVYAPGKWPGEVLHDSETTGTYEYSGRVNKTGPHAVSVFQSQQAIAEGMTAEYELLIEVKDVTN